MYSALGNFSSYRCFAGNLDWLPGRLLPLFGLILLVLAVWTLYWKGTALWKSARLKDKWWFIVLLLINTLGILEILYIYIWSKRESLKDRRGEV